MPELQNMDSEAMTDIVPTRAPGEAQPDFEKVEVSVCYVFEDGDIMMTGVSRVLPHGSQQHTEVQTEEMNRLRESVMRRDARISLLLQRVARLERKEKKAKKAKNLKAQLNEKTADYNRLSHALQVEQEKVSSHEAEIRKLQRHALHNMPDGESWTSGDDGTVKADLFKIQDRIKHWAKKHAAGLLTDIDGGRIRMINTPVARVARFATSGAPEILLGNVGRFSKSKTLNKKLPAMLLQALLADHIYLSIIGEPFFSMNHDKILFKVYCELEQGM